MIQLAIWVVEFFELPPMLSSIFVLPFVQPILLEEKSVYQQDEIPFHDLSKNRLFVSVA